MISCIHSDHGDVFFRGQTDNPDTLVGRSNDPLLSRKIELIVGTNSFVHPISNHTGEIIICSNGNQSLPLIQSGDAFIIGPGSTCSTGVLRVRDCLSVFGTVNGSRFGFHGSNITLLGWRQPSANFIPLPKQVFRVLTTQFNANMNDCQIYIGPCIAGIKGNGCDCYGYTETPSDHHGTDLINLIQKSYPEIVNLERFFFRKIDEDKVFFHWGALFVDIFKSLGIRENNIHTDYNYCTCCNKGWWSDRFFKNTSDQEQQKFYRNIGASNLAWITRQ